MLNIKIKGHNFEHEIKETVLQYEGFDLQDKYILSSILEEKNKQYNIYTSIELNNNKICKHEIQFTSPSYDEKLIKRMLKTSIYYVMEKAFNYTLPWGILTGIRPTKIIHKLFDQARTENEAFNVLINDYLVSEKKAKLLLEVAKNQRDIIYPISKDVISIYIGIPFCPSRCVYCSFVSHVLGKNRSLLKKYLDMLFYEIHELGKYISKQNLKIESIYIGGGTPTILNKDELKALLVRVKTEFDLSYLKEYTLEAGRPDTIDREKLSLSLNYKVNRISINPQTMNENTLIRIGRNHSPDQIIKTLNLSREMGFEIVNMDLILGLPYEDILSVKKTLKEIEKMQPENLTIHTMAIKKGSKLRNKYSDTKFAQKKSMETMIDLTQEFTSQYGYKPYYLYRQKYMAGNLENVGYCKNNYKSIFNINMMGEKQTIIGLGAGSVTKIIFPKEDRVERIPNPKDANQYIQSIDELISRKILLLDSLYN